MVSFDGYGSQTSVILMEDSSLVHRLSSVVCRPASVVLVTAPSFDVALEIIRAVVIERLAACGTILPGATSVYTWHGTVEEAQEVQIILKTTTENVTKLIARVTELHPYEVPEVVCLDVAAGLPAYLAWIDSSTI